MRQAFVLLFEMFLTPVLNIMATFANVAFITASACKLIKQNVIRK